jgi:glutamate N-acetyltransferase/amino-acid N-acetyltransferase
VSLSPLAPTSFPKLPDLAGLRLSSLAAGLRYKKRADLMVAVVEPGSSVAGVFTQSLCPSAPVDWCKEALALSTPLALVCNAGNANAFTGSAGATTARLTAESIAGQLGLQPHQVLLASTGVIGETLPTDALTDALPKLVAELVPASGDAWESAADAIRTTDTFAKGASASVEGGGVVAGIAKGSGMIAPDMATMLSFVFTDLAVEQSLLAEMVRNAVDTSFNRITVDSDTSTSDSVIVFATGQANRAPITHLDGAAELQDALDAVMLDLAHQVVRDGEGATKFVEVTIEGAADDASAKTIAMAVGNSPLVKTALAASDANWGRIVMAVGKAGQPADRDRLAIWIGDEQCAAGGLMRPAYNEERATAHLSGDEVSIRVDVGVGEGTATIWTCDLTHGYIEINAGYRT